MTTYKQIIYDGGDKVLVDMQKKAQKLNTARNINVTDADGSHTGTAASFDGSGDVNIKLPATISANITGNAQTADQAANAAMQTMAGQAMSATTAGSATTAATAGLADKAVILNTARTIQTDLASGTAASFDGSGNVTPGVTGVLPIANGGTGSSTQNWVGLTGNQIINGNKEFTALKQFYNDTYTPFTTMENYLLHQYDANGQTMAILDKYSTTGETGVLLYNWDGSNFVRFGLAHTSGHQARLVLSKVINGVYSETTVAVI